MRRIQAPGIEINEIDRSQYNTKSDNNLTDTAVLVTGFANNGPDYETRYIDNVQQFINLYGYPTNEAERYFYYGAKEVLNRRGLLYCAKLPYYNNAYDEINYIDYKVDTNIFEISSVQTLLSSDLIDIPIDEDVVKYDDPILGNNFLNTMCLRKCDIDTLRQFNNITKDHEFEYDLVNDFLTFMFDTAGEKYHITNTFNQYFRNYAGLYYLTDLLSVDQFADALVLSAYDLNPAIDVDICDDLSNLREDFKNYYNSSDMSPIDEAFLMFVKKTNLNQFKSYFTNFWSIFQPIVDSSNPDLLHGNNDTNFFSLWEKDFKNLSNYTGVFDTKYTDLASLDDTLTSYVNIYALSADKQHAYHMSFDQYDKFKTSTIKPSVNTFRIFDITRAKYGWNDDHDKQFLGIVPVITTAANAMFYQQLIQNRECLADYNCIGKIQAQWNSNVSVDLSLDKYYDVNKDSFLFSQELSSTVNNSGVADIACGYFPQLSYTSTRKIDRNYLKQIGIVVFKLLKTATSNNRVSFVPVESFVGSLKHDDEDLIKGTNVFLDTIVNENSQYINVFSNVDFSPDKHGKNKLDEASIYMVHDQTITSLGFYDVDSTKDIHVKKSIFKALDLIFDNNNNIDKRSLDIICDAGVSNIAQYIASVKQISKADVYDRYGQYDLVDCEGTARFRIAAGKQSSVWRQILQKYDNLCKYVRKDCMFIADSLRPTCLQGNEKVVRRTKPDNTIIKDVIPQLKYQININSSYGAGYCDWFYQYDDYSGLYFWCPPSIKATGVYVYSDIYYNYWDAPAGLNRGRITDAFDIAFNPTLDEAGKIYVNQWNYAMQYPIEGIVLEGQKTFQINHTAFDRVNVRRLFLKMEKLVYKIAKYFVYEGNTPYIRKRFVDTITPIFEEAKIGGGISEYVIICNDKNNTTQAIENHELHCTIAVRPVKTIEFVVMNFIALPQSGSFTEEELLKMTPYYGNQ